MQCASLIHAECSYCQPASVGSCQKDFIYLNDKVQLLIFYFILFIILFYFFLFMSLAWIRVRGSCVALAEWL